MKKLRLTFFIAAALLVMLLSASAAFAAGGFTDVAKDDFWLQYINAAQQRNIINGYPDGSFKPTKAVTKQQCVKMLSATLTPALNSDYASLSDDGKKLVEENNALQIKWNDTIKKCRIIDTYAPFAADLFEKGVISAADFVRDDGTYEGDDPASRQLIARWTARAMGYKCAQIAEMVYLDSDGISEDNISYTNALYREGIMEGTADKMFYPGDSVRRCEMAAVCMRLVGVDQRTRHDDILCSWNGKAASVNISRRLIELETDNGSVFLHVDKDAVLFVDGVRTDFARMNIEGCHITASAYIDEQNIVMIQTWPGVFEGTLVGLGEIEGKKLITLEYDIYRFKFVAGDDADLPDNLSLNQKYKLISDGLSVVEMR